MVCRAECFSPPLAGSPDNAKSHYISLSPIVQQDRTPLRSCSPPSCTMHWSAIQILCVLRDASHYATSTCTLHLLPPLHPLPHPHASASPPTALHYSHTPRLRSLCPRFVHVRLEVPGASFLGRLSSVDFFPLRLNMIFAAGS